MPISRKYYYSRFYDEYFKALDIGESDAAIENGKLTGFLIEGLHISLNQMGKEIPCCAILKELMVKLRDSRFVEGLLPDKKGSPGKVVY